MKLKTRCNTVPEHKGRDRCTEVKAMRLVCVQDKQKDPRLKRNGYCSTPKLKAPGQNLDGEFGGSNMSVRSTCP